MIENHTLLIRLNLANRTFALGFRTLILIVIANNKGDKKQILNYIEVQTYLRLGETVFVQLVTDWYMANQSHQQCLLRLFWGFSLFWRQ